MAYPIDLNNQAEKQNSNRQISILVVSHITDQKTAITGTLPELLVYFKSVLESGASCKGLGKRRVNTQPESISSLVLMLNNAKRNLCGRQEQSTTYRVKKMNDSVSSEYVLDN